MKKILIIGLSIFSFTSCYDDYVSDYESTGVYFAKQHNVRTLVVGEKTSIEIGVMMTGALSNEKNRQVSYRINNDLVNESAAIVGFQNHADSYVRSSFTASGVTALTAMPDDWYTRSNDEVITIPKGDHLGKITVNFDMDKFLNDAKDTKLPYYILPVEITNAPSIDKIVEGKSTTMIGVKYESKLFGNYWHGGVSEVRDNQGTIIAAERYVTAIPQPELRVYSLQTVGVKSLETNKIGMDSGSIRITLNDDNSVAVSQASSSSVVVTDEGSKFNNSQLLQNRKIFLKYKYDNGDGTTTHVTDTLTFRNRYRDGVNEWRSETPEDYN